MPKLPPRAPPTAEAEPVPGSRQPLVPPPSTDIRPGNLQKPDRPSEVVMITGSASAAAPRASSSSCRPSPLQVPELLDLILSFVPVDEAFSSSLLRTSRAFHDHLRPRLWAHVDLTGGNSRRHPTAFIECLTRAEAASKLKSRSARERPTPVISSVAFDIDDSSRERLDTERLTLLFGVGPATAITELSVNIVGEVDFDDISLDAEGIAEIVAHCRQLRRLVLRGHVSELVFARLHHVLGNMGPDAETRLASIELELPPEALLLRSQRIEVGPALPRIGTIRTLFAAPRRRKYARQLSNSLLGYILRTAEGDQPFQQTLILGPEVTAYLAGPLCTADDRKELALAQKVAEEANRTGDFQIRFPAGLDLSAELEREPAYQAGGIDALVELWYEDEWPLTLPEPEGPDDL